MAKFSEVQVKELLSNPVWKEMSERIKQLFNNNEFAHMENPDPFTHGVGVGSRKTIKAILSLPDIMLEEALGNNPNVRSLRSNIIPIKK